MSIITDVVSTNIPVRTCWAQWITMSLVTPFLLCSQQFPSRLNLLKNVWKSVAHAILPPCDDWSSEVILAVERMLTEVLTVRILFHVFLKPSLEDLQYLFQFIIHTHSHYFDFNCVTPHITLWKLSTLRKVRFTETYKTTRKRPSCFSLPSSPLTHTASGWRAGRRPTPPMRHPDSRSLHACTFQRLDNETILSRHWLVFPVAPRPH